MAARGELVCVGVVAGAHGVRGAVRIKSFTEVPEDLVAYGPVTDEAGTRGFALTLIGSSRGQLVARVAGVEDREAARALAGTRLYVARAALPAPADGDEYYVGDLVGLAVELEGGGAFGRVTAVHDFGAGQVLEIAPRRGPTVMVPFTTAAVPVVDVAGGRLVVDPPAGLLDAEDGAGGAAEE